MHISGNAVFISHNIPWVYVFQNMYIQITKDVCTKFGACAVLTEAGRSLIYRVIEAKVSGLVVTKTMLKIERKCISSRARQVSLMNGS